MVNHLEARSVFQSYRWVTTPSARLRKLRGISLIAQPPLLVEEGKSSRKKPSRLLPLCLTLLILSGLSACSKTSSRADETRGQALYQLHCAPCHETPPPDLLKEPPKLNGLFKSKTLPSGAPATDEQVQMVIVGGLRTMPAFEGRLQEQDIRDLVAYLHKM